MEKVNVCLSCSGRWFGVKVTAWCLQTSITEGSSLSSSDSCWLSAESKLFQSFPSVSVLFCFVFAHSVFSVLSTLHSTPPLSLSSSPPFKKALCQDLCFRNGNTSPPRACLHPALGSTIILFVKALCPLLSIN